MRKLRYAQIACQSGVECGEQFGSFALQGSSARSAVSVVQRSATLFRFPVLQREKATQPFEQKKKGLPLQPLLFCDFGEVAVGGGAVGGGEYRARTCDPLLVRQMLSQLS